MAATPSVRGSIRVGLPVFVLAFLATVTIVTLANNGWYPIGAAEFCGSLGDFHDGPVPTVCLSFVGYWYRAALHPPYATLAVLAGMIAAGAALGWRRGPSKR